MTPVALWTGRLPGLRPLPSLVSLIAVGVFVPLGLVGASLGGPVGPYVGAFASLSVAWIVFRHRWPRALPFGLRPKEAPVGPDERAVMVEVRQGEVLLGWDVGILWFERGGIGFAGRAASFVLPRSVMQLAPVPATIQSAVRAPRLRAQIFETTVGIVPLASELPAHMTLARIDALPPEVTAETVLAPTSLHPDLIYRADAIRRRVPLLVTLGVVPLLLMFMADLSERSGMVCWLVSAMAFAVVLFVGAFGLPPASVRRQLP